MRSLLATALCALLIVPLACKGGDDSSFTGKSQCNDGEDNDADGMTDFPDDLGCVAADDNDESDPPSAKCQDGRDNDGDGKTDYPSDPGCFAANQDSEEDDCPDGPSCPQCSDGKDNDLNGSTDWPSDSGGCMAASDTDEYTENPVACGPAIQIKQLPFDGHATGMLMNTGTSNLMSPTCGGMGTEDVYELRIQTPKVVVATTDNVGTDANTVLYIRGEECSNNASEMTCNDDLTTANRKSTVTHSLAQPGTYYLVVDAKDSASAGAYDLTVRFLTGEGEPCSGADDCGPGLVCRIPFGMATKVCAKHVCEDGLDDDQDGKNGYPVDPGCTSAIDDDEADTCPGAGCPECGDGADNDGDTMSDYPADTTCQSAADASEACVSSEGVTAITTGTVNGNTTTATNDSKPTCASSTGTAPDLMYRLDLPAMSSLSLNTTGFDAATALYNSSCTGTAIACSDPPMMNVSNLAAGTYYFLVDGWSTGSGAFTITVSGKIANGGGCESPLATAGAITCNLGYACKGTTGSKTCQPAKCSDGLDNDTDTKRDYPDDPGCTGPDDDTETDPATLPVCANTTDDDTDTTTDWPADFGCSAASGASEAFCTGEMDAPSLITTKTTTSTTVGKSNDWAPSCQSTSSAPDITYALQLPVPVDTLELDTIGSGFDTVLSVRNTQCNTVVACDDDSGGSFRSKIVLQNVSGGGYAVTIDGYSSGNGTTTLNVKGTVASGTRCSSPLFSGGASAVLFCPTGTSCTGSPLKCQ